MISTRTCGYQGLKKRFFYDKLYARTLWMAPNSVFVDASNMHLISIILRIFSDKSWFGLAVNYKRKCVRRLILGNIGTLIFKNWSPVQTVVVPPGETNISKLLTALFIIISLPLFESWFSGPTVASFYHKAYNHTTISFIEKTEILQYHAAFTRSATLKTSFRDLFFGNCTCEF